MSDKNEFTVEQWQNTMPENFDARADFVARIEPVVRQLQKDCEELGIPMLAMFADIQNDDGIMVSGYTQLNDISRVPAAMIAAWCLGNGQHEAVPVVLSAGHKRARAAREAKAGIGGVMTSVMKH